MTADFHTVGNMTIASGDYDHDRTLSAFRENRRRYQRDGGVKASGPLGDRLAETLAEDLPGIDAETIGRVLLCAGSKLGGLVAYGVGNAGHLINVLAFAADASLRRAPSPEGGERSA